MKKQPKQSTLDAIAKEDPVAAAALSLPDDYLDRAVLLDVCKDGTVSYRERAKKEGRLNGAALPVFSVDTVGDAQMIQTHFCAKQWDAHPKQPDRDWFRLPAFSGDIDALTDVSMNFLIYWLDFLVPKKTAPPPGSRWLHRRDKRVAVFDGLHFRASANDERAIAFATYHYELTSGGSPGRLRGRGNGKRSATPAQSMPFDVWRSLFTAPAAVVSKDRRAHMAQGRAGRR